MVALYVMWSGEFSKVGRARNVLHRWATLAGASPHDVGLWSAYWVPRNMATLAEAHCHAKLTPYHHRFEWFRVEPGIADQVVVAIARHACRSRGRVFRAVNIKEHQGKVRTPGPLRNQQMVERSKEWRL